VAVPPEPARTAALLRRRDFRRAFVAVVVSDLGDAFQYIALMWFALEAGGPLGLVAVRLADSVPALLFGFHGGAAVLVPIAIAGLMGQLPLAALVAAAFVLTAARSYWAPA